MSDGGGAYQTKFYHWAGKPQSRKLNCVISTDWKWRREVTYALFFSSIILVLIPGTIITANNVQRACSTKLQFALHRSTHTWSVFTRNSGQWERLCWTDFFCLLECSLCAPDDRAAEWSLCVCPKQAGPREGPPVLLPANNYSKDNIIIMRTYDENSKSITDQLIICTYFHQHVYMVSYYSYISTIHARAHTHTYIHTCTNACIHVHVYAIMSSYMYMYMSDNYL